MKAILNRVIDLFVHELAKLFGHIGTSEYWHGAFPFQVFLASQLKKCTGIEKQYYQSSQNVVLEHPVVNHHYVTFCNAGRLFFLHKAMVAFLNEQKYIKSLNNLEYTCLQFFTITSLRTPYSPVDRDTY